MTETTTPPIDAATLLHLPEARQIAFQFGGANVQLNVYPVTREMRNEALEAAAIAYQTQYNKKGFLPTVFERELATRVIKGWNLGKPVKTGWALLPIELGQKIVTLTGIEGAMRSLSGDESEDVKDAKNSSSGEGEIAPLAQTS